jgi:hypothetical protein
MNSSGPVGGKRTSFIQYVQPGAERPGAADQRHGPQPLVQPEAPLALQTGAGLELDRVLTRASASRVITTAERAVILGKLDNIDSVLGLQDAFVLLNRTVDNTLMAPETRTAFAQKLFERAAALEGGDEAIPMLAGQAMLTRAMGEDIFGMGNLPLTPTAELVMKVTKNEVITPAETRQLVAELGKIDDEYGLHAAYSALRFAVQGNAISTEDRGALARAYREATDRVGAGYVPVTRSPDEDVFGGGRSTIAEDTIAKARTNNVFSAAEITVITKEIGKITRRDEFFSVYAALQDAVGMRSEGAVLITDKQRAKLARALLEANEQNFGGDAMPYMATRAMNEDIFGSGRTPLAPFEARLANAVADNAISQGQTTSLIALFKGVKTEDEAAQLFGVLKQTVAMNLITREDRERLKAAVGEKLDELNVHFPQTRAVNEDLLGMYPMA